MKKLLLATAIMSVSGVALADTEQTLTARQVIEPACGIEFYQDDIEFGQIIPMRLSNNGGGLVSITEIEKRQLGPVDANFGPNDWAFTDGDGLTYSVDTYAAGEHPVTIESPKAQDPNSPAGGYVATAIVTVECALPEEDAPSLDIPNPGV